MSGVNTVGVRELKANASRILDEVQAHGQRYVVTRRGKRIAVIVPAGLGDASSETVEHDLGVWREMDDLAEEIGRRWPKAPSAVEALSDSRR
jgi:prevent-host-death family protein